MIYKNFSDEDIQNYVDGTYEGDLKEFETFLEQNPAIQRQVEAYRLVISAIEKEEYGLSLDLSAAVIHAIEGEKHGKATKDSALPALILAFTCAVALIVFVVLLQGNLFTYTGRPLFLILCSLALASVIIMFHMAEITIWKKTLHRLAEDTPHDYKRFPQ